MVQHLERIRPPGRNDPCPCGSGKKYKRCCLVHEAVAAPERHVEDVLAEVEAADEGDTPENAIEILLEARHVLHDVTLDRALADRYLCLPPDAAEAQLRQWWEQEHDRVSGTALARLLMTHDRRVEALALLNESQGNAEPEYWRLLAGLRDGQGDVDGAVTSMELYTRLAPDDGEAWLQLADLQRRSGQNDRALLSLRRAADVLPDRIVPRMLRLQILAENGRWREVRDLGESLREATFHDANPDALHDLRDVLARAYFVLGEFEAAREIWEVLLQERPEAHEVRYQLAQLELLAGRHRCALQVLDAEPAGRHEMRVLDLSLQCLLALHEYKEAGLVAQQIEEIDPLDRVTCLVHAAEARTSKEYAWALETLAGEPPDRYRDLWNNLRLDCLAQLGRWQEIPSVLKAITQPDDAVLISAALGSLANGKLDLAERLLDEMEDQHSATARSLSALLGPLRQLRRAAEVRRQQQVDEAEKQRRATENRDLRRRVRDLERHNEALANALAGSEASLERLLELVGVSSAGGVPADWERQIQTISERAHKDALAEELRQAEQRLRGMLGDQYWNRLSENARVALREGEWLFAAVEGEDRDYGASLLEYARGLERAFKDAIFVPIKKSWERQPGLVARLQVEGHDPSLGPFVRYILQSTHLTLGSMAAALDRMGDARRQGEAIALLRRRVGVDSHDERALEDWKRTAERLVAAANARNRPAHAASVSRESVQQFREMVLGTDGLLRALTSI